MRSYQDIKQHVQSLGFRWFENPFSLNFVWDRTGYHADNVFNHWLHIAYKDDQGHEQVLTIPATTIPGLKGSLLEPVTVDHITGTAVIKSPQQVVGGWQFHDTFDEFSKYPYFRQIKPVDYWRDGDKDHEIDKVQEQDQKIFGTHWHRMSNNGTYGEKDFTIGP
jgi:hypothetical protein